MDVDFQKRYEDECRFYRDNIRRLLDKHSGGFILYIGGSNGQYAHYETMESMIRAHPDEPALRDPTSTRDPTPLVIDIQREHDHRREVAKRKLASVSSK